MPGRCLDRHHRWPPRRKVKITTMHEKELCRRQIAYGRSQEHGRGTERRRIYIVASLEEQLQIGQAVLRVLGTDCSLDATPIVPVPCGAHRRDLRRCPLRQLHFDAPPAHPTQERPQDPSGRHKNQGSGRQLPRDPAPRVVEGAVAVFRARLLQEEFAGHGRRALWLRRAKRSSEAMVKQLVAEPLCQANVDRAQAPRNRNGGLSRPATGAGA
mmetsp:Transcript_136288/g.291055  ORF Transcript_136288/g.291055 Transcript_136288/m.291055 type:complete len:213 (+) Transcript_136288:1859-2497(+)